MRRCTVKDLDEQDVLVILKDVQITLRVIDPSMIAPRARKQYFDCRDMVDGLIADTERQSYDVGA